jgi:hypothetical protein
MTEQRTNSVANAGHHLLSAFEEVFIGGSLQQSGQFFSIATDKPNLAHIGETAVNESSACL